MFVFTISCEIHDSHYRELLVEELESLLYVIFVLRKFNFGGRWSAAPKNGGGGVVKENRGAGNPEKHLL